MKTKRLFALVCVSLTLLTLSVGVFAFQPPSQSPFVEYGAYQIGDFNSQNACQVTGPYSLCSCGTLCYSYVIADADIPDDYRGGSVFAIIDPTSLNRAFNGLYNVLSDDHTQSDHSINNCYRTYSSGSQSILTTRELTATDFNRYTLLLVDPSLAIDSGLRSFIDTNVISVTSHVGYSFALISVSPVQGYIDGLNDEALRDAVNLAYNDGLISGSENANAFDLISVVVDSVSSTVLETLYDINIMGLSLLHLVYFVVALSIVMLILKVVRG